MFVIAYTRYNIMSLVWPNAALCSVRTNLLISIIIVVSDKQYSDYGGAPANERTCMRC